MDFEDLIFKILGTVLALFVIGLIIYLPFYLWKSYSIEARIYNERNETSYSWSDFFFAGNQINQQTQTI